MWFTHSIWSTLLVLWTKRFRSQSHMRFLSIWSVWKLTLSILEFWRKWLISMCFHMEPFMGWSQSLFARIWQSTSKLWSEKVQLIKKKFENFNHSELYWQKLTQKRKSLRLTMRSKGIWFEMKAHEETWSVMNLNE